MVAVMKTLIILLALLFSACASLSNTVYQDLGGHSKIEAIVNNLIVEIEKDPIIFEYFKESDVERFRTKLTEHICFHTRGPCEYTGDDMKRVHDGMNMTESDFNRDVDLLIMPCIRQVFLTQYRIDCWQFSHRCAKKSFTGHNV